VSLIHVADLSAVARLTAVVRAYVWMVSVPFSAWQTQSAEQVHANLDTVRDKTEPISCGARAPRLESRCAFFVLETQVRFLWLTVFLGVLVWSEAAMAELYQYQGPDGEVIITTERRSDLKLIEVIEGKSGKTVSEAKVQKQVKTPDGRSVITTAPTREAERGEDAFDDIIREASAAYDVPFGFVKGVIRVESHFNPNAMSPVGAMGLMQLMPRTAASVNVTDPFDPRQNIFGGTRFLRILIDRYDGDINLILAAYNAGDAAVARYDGIPYPQTRGYVAHVYRWYRTYAAQELVD